MLGEDWFVFFFTEAILLQKLLMTDFQPKLNLETHNTILSIPLPLKKKNFCTYYSISIHHHWQYF